MNESPDIPPELAHLESRLKALRPAPVSDALQQKLHGISEPRVLRVTFNTWWRPALVAMVALCVTPLVYRVVNNPSVRVAKPGTSKAEKSESVVPSWAVYQRAMQDGDLDTVLSDQAYQYSSNGSYVRAYERNF